VGIDVVRDGETFKRPCDTWFTPAEREWIRHTSESGIAAVLWSAKEAAYKATNLGEAFIPGQYEILQDDTGSYSWIRSKVPLQNSGGVIVRRREGLTVTLATFSLNTFALRLSP
jgi:phosphopantetheinyl transferase (holo-ACP synthase)